MFEKYATSLFDENVSLSVRSNEKHSPFCQLTFKETLPTNKFCRPPSLVFGC